MFIEQPILKVVKQQEKDARTARENVNNGARTGRSKGSSISNSVTRPRKQDSTPGAVKHTMQTNGSQDNHSVVQHNTSLTIDPPPLNPNALKELETSMDTKPEYKVEKYLNDAKQRTNTNFNKKASIQSNDKSLSSVSSRRVKPAKSKLRDKTPQTNNKTQKEFIKQFGTQKGQQYYGAIRELEEFLDPGVLNDDDFKINQKTVDDINSVHANILDKSSIEHSQDISIFDRQAPYSQGLKKRVLPTHNSQRFQPGSAKPTTMHDSRMSNNKQMIDMTNSTDFEYGNIPPLKNPLSVEGSLHNKKKKKKQLQSGHTEDMLLMNLRMKMSTQEAQSRKAMKPMQTHVYGFNDSIGDLRNNGQKLIFDPQHPNRPPPQRQVGYITPNINERKNMRPQQKGRHKSVNQRNYAPAYHTGNSALPRIQHINTNTNSLTKVSTSISKKNGPFGGLTDMMQTKGSSSNFYSNKPSIQPTDDVISQRVKMAQIATPSTPNRVHDPTFQSNPNYDYQMAQEARIFKAKQKLNQEKGGKIILKKINHFTDNSKLNKTYKNEVMHKLQMQTEIKSKKSGLDMYDKKRGSVLYTREADIRQDPTMLKKFKVKKTSEKQLQQNIYMNQEQYRGLIDILEQQNKILQGVSPDQMIEGSNDKFNMTGENFTTGGMEEQLPVNIQVENTHHTPIQVTKKQKLDSQKAVRKGAQTAPRGAKRPTVPPAAVNTFNQQVIKVNREQQSNILKYLNRKMTNNGDSNQYYSQSNFKDQFKQKKSSLVPKRTLEVSRNKSAPKRRRQEAVQRSLPNQLQMNRLVQKNFKEKKFQDDEILNIKIKNKSRQRSQDSMNLPKQIAEQDQFSRTQILNNQRRAVTNNQKQRRKTTKSPGISGQYQFRQSKVHNGETINSHRTTIVPLPLKKQKGEPSLSSIYGPGRNDNLSRSYLSQAQALREYNNSQSQRSLMSSRSKRSNAQSEISRMHNRDGRNHRQKMNLDQRHLALLKDPDNIRNVSLFTPEGYSTDHKRDLDNFSNAKYKAYERAESIYPTKSNSAQGMMEKGLKYKFSLKDLSKYSKNLKFKDINWKLQLSALGKKIPDIKERKKILIKGSHFNTLLKLLKQTDWSRTPVYHQFLRNGRWKHEDDQIYSEIELKYNQSVISKFINGMNATELKEKYEGEQKTISEKYYNKTMHTLEVLMNQLNMMYYWEKIRLMFIDQDPNLIQLQKLMGRAIKCYNMIDNFIKIFKLIRKKELLDENNEQDCQLCKRLKISIKLLLKENPVLPNAFNYKGTCLMETLQKELTAAGYEDLSEGPSSPTKRDLKMGAQHSTDSKVLALSPGKDPFDVESLQED